jgi:hypothetical protein
MSQKFRLVDQSEFCIFRVSSNQPHFVLTWCADFLTIHLCCRPAEIGFEPWWKILSRPPLPSNKGEPARNLCSKSERLTFSCRAIWAWPERVSLYGRQIMILPRKTKTYGIYWGSGPPSGPPGPSNLYRLTPLTPSRQYWCTAAWVSLGAAFEVDSRRGNSAFFTTEAGPTRLPSYKSRKIFIRVSYNVGRGRWSHWPGWAAT